MTRDRLNQIRKAVDYDPLCAESYTGELIRAVDQYIRDSHAQSSALREALAEAEQLRGALRPTGHNLKTCCCPDCCTLRQVKKERDRARAECKHLREIVKTAGDRLMAVAHHLTEFSYQELASVLFDLPAPAEEAE